MLESTKKELEAGDARYWLNTHTNDLFYLSKYHPMRLIDKKVFKILLEDGFIIKSETTAEVEEYVAKSVFDREQAERSAHSGFIRWLSE